MKKSFKILAITLTLALMATAVGAAVVMAADGSTATPTPAVTQPPAKPPANTYDQLLLTKLVSKLGTTTDNLTAAYKSARVEVLAQEVKDGKLTQTQADAIKARWDKETDVRVSFTMGFMGFMPRDAQPKAAPATPPATPTAPAVNTYDQLLLTKIVAKLGTTLDKFTVAYKASRLEVLAQQVTDGKTTQAQADQIKAMWDKDPNANMGFGIGFGAGPGPGGPGFGGHGMGGPGKGAPPATPPATTK